MIKLRQRDGARFEPGIDAAHMIATRRVPERALRDIFGAQSDVRIERLVHPAVRQIPGVREEIERQRNKPPTTA